MDLTGSVIVASPNLSKYSNFAKTVVYIVRHDQKIGTIGLIVNHILNIPAKALHIKHNQTLLKLKNLSLHYGGPVATEKGFILHVDKKAKIKNNLAIRITSNIRTLKSIISGKADIQNMFVFGYCNWNAGQIEKEIATDKWVVLNTLNTDIIFDTRNESKWDVALSTMQINALFYNNALGSC